MRISRMWCNEGNASGIQCSVLNIRKNWASRRWYSGMCLSEASEARPGIKEVWMDNKKLFKITAWNNNLILTWIPTSTKEVTFGIEMRINDMNDAAVAIFSDRIVCSLKLKPRDSDFITEKPQKKNWKSVLVKRSAMTSKRCSLRDLLYHTRNGPDLLKTFSQWPLHRVC